MAHGQQPLLAERTEDRSHDLRTAWDAAVASGAIRCDAVATIGPIVTDVCRLAGLTNLAQQAGIALTRLGPDARRSRDLLRELGCVSTSDQPAGRGLIEGPPVDRPAPLTERGLDSALEGGRSEGRAMSPTRRDLFKFVAAD